VMDVTLRISDRLACAKCGAPSEPTCQPLQFQSPVDQIRFDGSAATVSYVLQCDPTNPVVDAGGSQFVTDDNLVGGKVQVTLTAVGSDVEWPQGLEYNWDCKENNQSSGFQASETFQCLYDPPTTAQKVVQPQVTIRNVCGLTASDSTQVTITQTNPGG